MNQGHVLLSVTGTATLNCNYTSFASTDLLKGTLIIGGPTEQAGAGSFEFENNATLKTGVLGIRDGSIFGTGTVDGNLVLGNNPLTGGLTNPTLKPGTALAPIGIIRVTENFHIFAGTMTMEIAGPAGGTISPAGVLTPGDYDQVIVAKYAAFSNPAVNSNVTGVRIPSTPPKPIKDTDTIAFLKSTDFKSDFVTVTKPGDNWDYGHDDKDAWFKLKPGKISGRVFRDDGFVRGQFEPGVESVLAGIPVALFDENGANQLGSSITDASGNYEFANLHFQLYRVAFTKPNDLRASPANAAPDDVDSDPDPDTGWVNVEVSESGNPEHVDAGFYPNSPPIAANDSASTNEDTAVDVSVLANDTDADSDGLTIASVGVAAAGTTSISGSVLHYTPNANFHGTDSFLYTISDGYGGTSSAMVLVTVNPVNDNPTAVVDTATVVPNFPSYLMVIGNDFDIDGDTVSLSAIAVQPSHGTASISGNSIVYTPTTGYGGGDSLTYQISDGHGGTATAVVSITVTSPGGTGGAGGTGGGGTGGGGGGVISGLVFNDQNHNGVQDFGEFYFGTAIQINLLDTNGVAVATTWTSGSLYSFSGIAAGQYRIQVILPSGYTFAPQDQGSDGSDSDVDANGYSGFFLFDGTSHLDYDGGIYLT